MMNHSALMASRNHFLPND